MTDEELKNMPEKKHENRDFQFDFQRDQLSTIIWACILIWGGLVFLAKSQGWLSAIPLTVSTKFEWEWFNQTWLFICLGAGALLLVELLIRLVFPRLHKRNSGNAFLAILLIGIAISAMIGVMSLWPVILIAIGLSLILRNVLK